MNPSLEQLAGQFTRLVESVPASVAAVPAPASPTTATPAPAAVVVAAPPPGPVQTVDFALKGFHLDARVDSSLVVAAAEILDRAGFGIDAITGVDWLAQNELEVVYDYFHPTSPLRVVVRTRIPRVSPEVPSIGGVFPGANWHERETHDFFGILFAGNSNMKPFLLPEDADFHPLLKDYKP